jgi:hypothetical protein
LFPFREILSADPTSEMTFNAIMFFPSSSVDLESSLCGQSDSLPPESALDPIDGDPAQSIPLYVPTRAFRPAPGRRQGLRFCSGHDLGGTQILGKSEIYGAHP